MQIRDTRITTRYVGWIIDRGRGEEMRREYSKCTFDFHPFGLSRSGGEKFRPFLFSPFVRFFARSNFQSNFATQKRKINPLNPFLSPNPRNKKREGKKLVWSYAIRIKRNWKWLEARLIGGNRGWRKRELCFRPACSGLGGGRTAEARSVSRPPSCRARLRGRRPLVPGIPSRYTHVSPSSSIPLST